MHGFLLVCNPSTTTIPSFLVSTITTLSPWVLPLVLKQICPTSIILHPFCWRFKCWSACSTKLRSVKLISSICLLPIWMRIASSKALLLHREHNTPPNNPVGLFSLLASLEISAFLFPCGIPCSTEPHKEHVFLPERLLALCNRFLPIPFTRLVRLFPLPCFAMLFFTQLFSNPILAPVFCHGQKRAHSSFARIGKPKWAHSSFPILGKAQNGRIQELPESRAQIRNLGKKYVEVLSEPH